ncbi:MAG TPA: biopolymer transporter ExbD [Candidatus Cloacimonas sp.]|jgi:biopolymer transport protein ExbD|nr:biopolymer transport protein ExbD [Candidatus Cloacimonadota bacterium]HCX73447.1 biopolymer transporter ExbD [Candidatus Cloacimonas sp.]
MQFKNKRKNLSGIPTSSMSDVAFLLLIFFLTTTKFDIKKGLGLVLPPASTQADKKVRLKQENITKVWVNQKGQVALNEEIVPLNELESKVRNIVLENPDMVISFKTDRQSKYDYMVRVLDVLQAAGAEKISLSTN